jgi:hypothetical protein
MPRAIRSIVGLIGCSATLLMVGRVSAADAVIVPTAQATEQSSEAQTLNVDGVEVRIEFSDADDRIDRSRLDEWIERSLRIVAGYYRRFPTKHLLIRISAVDGAGVRSGTTFGIPQAFIRLQVGRDVTPEQMRDDWILVHEMIHLALPDVGRAHAWLSEGIATYVEGVARAQAGNRSVLDVWSEFVRSMPQGLPEAGDQGLDNTPTWGRTYWGGALFCLLADVEIRKRTNNRFGLQDALRAVAQASGGLASDWLIARVLSTADAAVGTSALADLYAQMKDAAVTPDLAALWKNLGIEPDGESIRLREDAPLASIRKAITQSKVSKPLP